MMQNKKVLVVKHIFKIISINFLVLISLIIGPSFGYWVFKQFKQNIQNPNNKILNSRANYPTYKDKSYSKKLFLELSQLTTQYVPFLGWKRDPVNFRFTNISGQYNNRISSGQELNKSTWFFGGSTMWGIGTSDEYTIPSQYNKFTNKKVFNFGETGWNSRQSLNQLMNAIGDGYIPKEIIFLDGINDVSHNCRSEIKQLPSHYFETIFKKKNIIILL